MSIGKEYDSQDDKQSASQKRKRDSNESNGSDENEKKLIRRERNKQTAREARKRKVEELQALKEENARLKEENARLEREAGDITDEERHSLKINVQYMSIILRTVWFDKSETYHPDNTPDYNRGRLQGKQDMVEIFCQFYDALLQARSGGSSEIIESIINGQTAVPSTLEKVSVNRTNKNGLQNGHSASH